MKKANTPDAPVISSDQSDQLAARAKSWPRQPDHPEGTKRVCPECRKRTLLTTNDLAWFVPVTHGVQIVTRLPGALCTSCNLAVLDAAGIALLHEHSSQALPAHYQTLVSRSGNVPAVLVKEDLRRVLGIHQGTRLAWTILDRRHALVEVLGDD